MLILTRKTGEKIIIGQNAEIKISILRIKRNQTLVGIEVKRTIPVHRSELRLSAHSRKIKKGGINGKSICFKLCGR